MTAPPQCTAIYACWRCLRPAGHIGYHRNTWHGMILEWPAGLGATAKEIAA